MHLQSQMHTILCWILFGGHFNTHAVPWIYLTPINLHNTKSCMDPFRLNTYIFICIIFVQSLRSLWDRLCALTRVSSQWSKTKFWFPRPGARHLPGAMLTSAVVWLTMNLKRSVTVNKSATISWRFKVHFSSKLESPSCLCASLI